MGVLKNDVGRPSKKTIMIRTILKIVALIILLVLVAVLAYYLGNNNGNKKQTNIKITKKSEETISDFDKSQITTKSGADDSLDLYVYGNKVKGVTLSEDELGITKIDTLKDIAVIELSGIDNRSLLIVNKKGEDLFLDENEGGYICYSDYLSECYGYKIDGNKITLKIADLGQEMSYVCDADKDKQVLAEYELTYKDGKLLKEKKSSLTAKEYIEKYNIDCSNY